jgi:segregation and condensation protein A
MSDLPAEAADTDLETEWDKHLPHDGADALIVDVDGFEGPLDVLLALGRAQKVDLRKISILRLTEQYLTFIEKARVLKIELAADYLVMAAWLAYLKSRLLLPPETTDDEPSGEDLAARLAFQLERLAAMRECAAQLMARDQLGRDRFPRGMTEAMTSDQAHRIHRRADRPDAGLCPRAHPRRFPSPS